ncbi:hypothetical protein [Actinoplanes sp. DH11]|uniref:hypothetical protein n=1 Tax=Actinoplanes sp. DH11 TaxID=2857011 RepID=UPI001E4F430A|nr:hypothetical protein [Actinoplanes sp. DH11]
MSEGTYRRWLALYPSDFRAEYEEEMLAVLMSEGRPGPAQFFDLARAAVAVRLRQVTGSARWRQAAWLTQTFGAILLLALALRHLVTEVAVWDSQELFGPGLSVSDAVALPQLAILARVSGWAVVLIAALRGWRLLGLAGAVLGLGGQAVAPAQLYLETPATVLNAYWQLMAAAVVLAAGVVAVRGGARTRGLVPLLAAAAALVLQAVMLLRWFSWEIYNGLPWVALALAAVAAARQEPAMRPWLLTWAAPVLVTVPLVRTGFDGFIEHNIRHPEATRLLDGFQWTALVLVPLAAFLFMALLTSRFERGRAARAGGAA